MLPDLGQGSCYPRPSQDQVLSWKIDTLREIADSVEAEDGGFGIEPGIGDIRYSMRRAIHDLDWSGAARNAATGPADRAGSTPIAHP